MTTIVFVRQLRERKNLAVPGSSHEGHDTPEDFFVRRRNCVGSVIAANQTAVAGILLLVLPPWDMFALLLFLNRHGRPPGPSP